MPRRPRWFQQGLPLHVVQRGNNRMPCFGAVEDRQSYLDWLRELAGRLRVGVHAYVLMSNHVHLLVPPESQLATSELMQSLGRRYVRYFNEKHGRTGTLWEGRFKAHPVQSDAHFLCIHRYVELNPVRAGMVANAGQYRWSSHMHYAFGRRDDLISHHPIYLAMGRTSKERQLAYRSMFRDVLDSHTLESIRSATSSGRPFGDVAFRERLSRELSLPLGGKNGRPTRKCDPPASQGVLLPEIETGL